MHDLYERICILESFIQTTYQAAEEGDTITANSLLLNVQATLSQLKQTIEQENARSIDVKV